MAMVSGCGNPSFFKPPELRIVNVGDAPTVPFRVHVRGQVQDVGPIAAGDSVTVRLLPESESGIYLENALTGDRQAVPGSYVEKGWGARFRVTVVEDSIVGTWSIFGNLPWTNHEPVRVK